MALASKFRSSYTNSDEHHRARLQFISIDSDFDLQSRIRLTRKDMFPRFVLTISTRRDASPENCVRFTCQESGAHSLCVSSDISTKLWSGNIGEF